MRWLVVGISVLGIASTSLVGAAPANASLGGVSKYYEAGDPDCSSNLRTRARYQHVTDDVLAYDDCEDGWGSRAELSLQTGQHPYCYNQGGVGTVLTCPHDYAENVFGVILATAANNGNFVGSGDQVVIYT